MHRPPQCLIGQDVRTVRRACAAIRDLTGAVVPTRGTVEDIGPGVTHKAIAVRHWMAGKEPVAVAQAICHTLRSTERYLQTFMRVVYLHRKQFGLTELALTVGISTAEVATYLDLYREYVPKPEFQRRWEEIDLVAPRTTLRRTPRRGRIRHAGGRAPPGGSHETATLLPGQHLCAADP